ncbi:hypothetical protein QOZ80_2AG0137790 [Eleusine coracana subsp. coracana]|nr:hypothetical protein QOZ80_2AG0137790 [Eleusine coracana subsp. coracana]
MRFDQQQQAVRALADAGRGRQQQRHEGTRVHLLSGTPARHDASSEDAAVTNKGCATFLVVGEEGDHQAPRRVAVLLGEARDGFGFAHEGVERFMRAVEAADRRHRHEHHHRRRHFWLPHIARCFRPSHAVA